MDAHEIFSRDGALTRRMTGYEFRAGQLEMAAAVERSLNQDRIVLCEAGTGTGKTLAYLIPAILSGKKVVVSTATRTLQEQIFRRDLPLIERTLGLSADAALMKGLGNYLCLRRHRAFRNSAEAEHGENPAKLRVISNWLEHTTQGDLGEIQEIAEGDPILSQIASSSDTRVGSACPHYEQCFVTRMKRSAGAARLLIVNHHLFFADLALRGPHPGQVIPDYDAIIFDEAHRLEDIATSFFSLRLSSAKLESVMREAERAFEWVKSIGATSLETVAKSQLTRARRASAEFFEHVRGAHPLVEGRAAVGADTWNGEGMKLWHELDACLEGLAVTSESVRGRVMPSEADPRERKRLAEATDELELSARRLHKIRDDLASIVENARGFVVWLEQTARTLELSASPVDLSQTLRYQLFEAIPSIVLTSATLADGSRKREDASESDDAAGSGERTDFKFLRSRLGLEEEGLPVSELVVPAPFDFENRSLLYIPKDLPEPTAPGFIAESVERIVELVELTSGGAFVLTTSLRAMQEIHRRLSARTNGRLLLVQGAAPKHKLLEQFRQDGNAVLVATISFWEGVDVPGRALRLVIMDKIPFAVPTDPIVSARAQKLEEIGKNPFIDLYVPGATILLKQGFGRLIRRHDDVGIVAVLDGRLLRRGYGKKLLRALPPARRVTELDEVRRFWQGLIAESPRPEPFDPRSSSL